MIEINIAKATILKTNNYIINDDDHAVLIEASVKAEEVKKIIKGKKILAILLTHGHWDHFLHLDELLDVFPCQVYMTKEAFKKIISKQKSFSADINPGLDLQEKQVVFIENDEVLNFGEKFKFKVIRTSGHTDCSVSYLLNEKYLFSGDTLFKDDYGRFDLPTGDEGELKKSLDFLMELNPNIEVYPGHGISTTIKNERKNFS